MQTRWENIKSLMPHFHMSAYNWLQSLVTDHCEKCDVCRRSRSIEPLCNGFEVSLSRFTVITSDGHVIPSQVILQMLETINRMDSTKQMESTLLRMCDPSHISASTESAYIVTVEALVTFRRKLSSKIVA